MKKAFIASTTALLLIGTALLSGACGKGDNANNNQNVSTVGCGSGQLSTSQYGCVAQCSPNYNSYGSNPYNNPYSSGTYGMVNGTCTSVTLTGANAGSCPPSYQGYPLVAATVQGTAACCKQNYPQIPQNCIPLNALGGQSNCPAPHYWNGVNCI